MGQCPEVSELIGFKNMEIYLVFVDAIQNSNKFWSAKVEDSNLTVQWGRVGYQAQTKVHTLANFGDSYISALNEYLKIVPTPLGMQIDYHRVYRTVADIDYQRELLNSLLTTSAPQVAAVAVATPQSTVEPKVVSLKTISKNFWRHL